MRRRDTIRLPIMSEPPSSPPNEQTSPEEAIAYYKRQYEALEAELQDFRISSQELENELEKDAEIAEGKERVWREKAEGLAFEVEEWKTKYKQSKAEANAAQNALQKEITMLRDTNRNLQLKLRDIEVANDDFERQARNTTSSMEDLESKYNVAIERSVMMDEEIKIGEQEREALRIETQRLREELSDLKIEAEIAHDKLEKANARQLPSLSTHMGTEISPYSRRSLDSAASSPMITTPPDTKSISTSDTVSETPTPPSPPMSDVSRDARKSIKTPIHPQPTKIRMPSGNISNTSKPATARVRDTRRPTINSRSTPSVIRNVVSKAHATRGLPNSTSLTHIRNLTAQMQRLEQRVHSARSKLPAPVNTTPPRPSPRGSLAYVPPSVTIRSRKRTEGSAVTRSSTSSVVEDNSTPSSRHASRISTTGISRLSFGPISAREGGDSRPTSRTGTTFSTSTSSRPDSRTELEWPYNRTSIGGARTPLGHFSQSALAESRRPRSGVGYHQGHGQSNSVSHITGVDEESEYGDRSVVTPSRRSTVSRSSDFGSGIPLPRRTSGGTSSTSPVLVRRKNSQVTSSSVESNKSTQVNGSMRPPERRPRRPTGLGETY